MKGREMLALRRAIGGRKRHLRVLLALESMFIGFIGGLFGALVAVLAILVVTWCNVGSR